MIYTIMSKGTISKNTTSKIIQFLKTISTVHFVVWIFQSD